MTVPHTQRDATAGKGGLRVVEMGQLIAGPFCGKALGEFASIALDLRSSKGQDIARRLIAEADVLSRNAHAGNGSRQDGRLLRTG